MFFRILNNLKNVDRMQRRMHNKIFVADNAVAITGGSNLGKTYFDQSDNANFVCIDILAAGRIARDLSRSFDQYRNNPQAYPVQSLMTARAQPAAWITSCHPAGAQTPSRMLPPAWSRN